MLKGFKHDMEAQQLWHQIVRGHIGKTQQLLWKVEGEGRT